MKKKATKETAAPSPSSRRSRTTNGAASDELDLDDRIEDELESDDEAEFSGDDGDGGDPTDGDDGSGDHEDREPLRHML
ncbi:MAG: hypothetical protein R3F19_28340 [Verrucomicrobiales bacterium]